MFRVNSPLIALAALAAVGIVTADSLYARTSNTAATNIAARFPAQDQMFAAYTPAASAVTVNSDRAAKKMFVPSEDCVHEHWPYIADECLVADDGVPVKPVRTITIEKRVKTPAAKVLVASSAAAIR
jgi:hypothetical protein